MTSPLKPEGKEAADLEEALALLGGLKLRVKVLDPTKRQTGANSGLGRSFRHCSNRLKKVVSLTLHNSPSHNGKLRNERSFMNSVP